MPRTLVRAPGTDRKRSLGWLALAWMEFFVRHGRGGAQGKKIRHGDEFTLFIVDCYALLITGRMPYDSVFFSRPKGADKSGLAARIALFEALGPCRFAGWAKGGEVYEDPWGLGFRYVYQPGEPMGAHVVDPFIRCMATEETQVGNVYASIYFNLTDKDCLLSRIPGMDAGLTRVLLPGGGEIRRSTAAGASKDGGLETFAVIDESHLYKTPELRDMYGVVTRNLVKRKAEGTWYLETTTMFAPGEQSVAEGTYQLAEMIKEGQTRRARLLYDHRWGDIEEEKLSREEMLRAAILEAFGEAIDWNDIDAIIDEFYDPRKDVKDSIRYFLNAESKAKDAWLGAQEWKACERPDSALRDGDFVTLGFDGSISEDSTALVACRVSDGYLELLGVWEKPSDHRGDGWRVDTVAVNLAVAKAMTRFEVAAFYADPPHWQNQVDAWTADWGDQMQVKATAGRPLEWWTNRTKAVIPALERFRSALRGKELSFAPAPPDDVLDERAGLVRTLRRHALNARVRDRPGGEVIAKEYPKSPRKIDAVMAAVLAYEARSDAIAKGVQPQADKVYAARRIR